MLFSETNFVYNCSKLPEFDIKPNALDSIRIFMVSNAIKKFLFLVTFTMNIAPHSEWSAIHEYFRYELRLFPIPDCSKGLTQGSILDQAGTV